jgi:hypothetical protein
MTPPGRRLALQRRAGTTGPRQVDQPVSLTARLKELANFIAPTTAVTALLIYFGFVGTRARFAYFGVYLDLADLSNRALVLYGLEVLYVPAAIVFLAILLAVGTHAMVTWILAAPSRHDWALAGASVAGLGGLLLTARAVVGIVVVRVAREERPGATALALAIGPFLIAYACWIAGRAALGDRAGGPARDRFAAWYGTAQVTRLRRAGAFAVAGLVVAGLFWAANSFAAGFGTGRAVDDATALPRRPEVVLDTKERLIDPPEGVTETALPAHEGQTFRYRYRGLRLLLATGGRLFLVPERWTDQGRTLVVPNDAQLRLQLVPPPPQ